MCVSLTEAFGGLTGYDLAESAEPFSKHRNNFRAYLTAFGLLEDVNSGSLDASEVHVEENPGPSTRNIETTRTDAAGDDGKSWLDMRLKSYGRTFFRTQKGYYGLGPRIIPPGNQCVVLAGVTVSSIQ